MSQAYALTEAQSDAPHGPQPVYTPGTNDLLYVSNAGNNSITVYPHTAQYDEAPKYVIAGSKTGITAPGQLSEDAQGNLYLAITSNTRPSILVFAHGANGNVAPIRKIAGPLTGLHNVEAVTVDQSTGKIFVVDSAAQYPGLSGLSELVRFAPNANGNVAPFARSATDTVSPAYELTSDSTGANVIEVGYSYPYEFDGGGFGAFSYPKQFSNGAALSIPYYVSYFYAKGIVDDPTTKTYLTSGNSGTESGIDRFAEKTIGHGVVTE